MTTTSPKRLREPTVWLLTAFMTLGGAAISLVTVDGPPTPRPQPSSVILTSADRAVPRAERPATVDPALFQARLLASAPFEAALRRAFAAPSVLIAAVNGHRRSDTVRAGATPQACLTQAVYYEARGEPEAGQAAVAQVVINRTRSGAHPASVCGVVFEGASRRGCQFSFACDPRLSGRRPDPASWRRAEQVAEAALAGREAVDLRYALNYHAAYVKPGWAGRLQRAAEIGRHIFYAALPAAAPPYASE